MPAGAIANLGGTLAKAGTTAKAVGSAVVSRAKQTKDMISSSKTFKSLQGTMNSLLKAQQSMMKANKKMGALQFLQQENEKEFQKEQMEFWQILLQKLDNIEKKLDGLGGGKEKGGLLNSLLNLGSTILNIVGALAIIKGVLNTILNTVRGLARTVTGRGKTKPAKPGDDGAKPKPGDDGKAKPGDDGKAKPGDDGAKPKPDDIKPKTPLDDARDAIKAQEENLQKLREQFDKLNRSLDRATDNLNRVSEETRKAAIEGDTQTADRLREMQKYLEQDISDIKNEIKNVKSELKTSNEKLVQAKDIASELQKASEEGQKGFFDSLKQKFDSLINDIKDSVNKRIAAAEKTATPEATPEAPKTTPEATTKPATETTTTEFKTNTGKGFDKASGGMSIPDLATETGLPYENVKQGINNLNQNGTPEVGTKTTVDGVTYEVTKMGTDDIGRPMVEKVKVTIPEGTPLNVKSPTGVKPTTSDATKAPEPTKASAPEVPSAGPKSSAPSAGPKPSAPSAAPSAPSAAPSAPSAAPSASTGPKPAAPSAAPSAPSAAPSAPSAGPKPSAPSAAPSAPSAGPKPSAPSASKGSGSKSTPTVETKTAKPRFKLKGKGSGAVKGFVGGTAADVAIRSLFRWANGEDISKEDFGEDVGSAILDFATVGPLFAALGPVGMILGVGMLAHAAGSMLDSAIKEGIYKQAHDEISSKYSKDFEKMLNSDKPEDRKDAIAYMTYFNDYAAAKVQALEKGRWPDRKTGIAYTAIEASEMVGQGLWPLPYVGDYVDYNSSRGWETNPRIREEEKNKQDYIWRGVKGNLSFEEIQRKSKEWEETEGKKYGPGSRNTAIMRQERISFAQEIAEDIINENMEELVSLLPTREENIATLGLAPLAAKEFLYDKVVEKLNSVPKEDKERLRLEDWYGDPSIRRELIQSSQGGLVNQALGFLYGLQREEYQKNGSILEDIWANVSQIDLTDVQNFYQKAASPTDDIFANETPIQRNSGGYVPGPNVNKDIVPAMLTPGEFVLTRDAVKSYGLDALYAMNKGMDPEDMVKPVYLSEGGLVQAQPVTTRTSDLTIIPFDQTKETPVYPQQYFEDQKKPQRNFEKEYDITIDDSGKVTTEAIQPVSGIKYEVTGDDAIRALVSSIDKLEETMSDIEKKGLTFGDNPLSAALPSRDEIVSMTEQEMKEYAEKQIKILEEQAKKNNTKLYTSQSMDENFLRAREDVDVAVREMKKTQEIARTQKIALENKDRVTQERAQELLTAEAPEVPQQAQETMPAYSIDPKAKAQTEKQLKKTEEAIQRIQASLSKVYSRKDSINKRTRQATLEKALEKKMKEREEILRQYEFFQQEPPRVPVPAQTRAADMRQQNKEEVQRQAEILSRNNMDQGSFKMGHLVDESNKVIDFDRTKAKSIEEAQQQVDSLFGSYEAAPQQQIPPTQEAAPQLTEKQIKEQQKIELSNLNDQSETAYIIWEKAQEKLMQDIKTGLTDEQYQTKQQEVNTLFKDYEEKSKIYLEKLEEYTPKGEVGPPSNLSRTTEEIMQSVWDNISESIPSYTPDATIIDGTPTNIVPDVDMSMDWMRSMVASISKGPTAIPSLMTTIYDMNKTLTETVKPNMTSEGMPVQPVMAWNSPRRPIEQNLSEETKRNRMSDMERTSSEPSNIVMNNNITSTQSGGGGGGGFPAYNSPRYSPGESETIAHMRRHAMHAQV